MNLTAAKTPAYLMAGFFGNTGTGKTFTAVKMLAQFSKEYANSAQLAMFDTEPSAGFVAPLVKKITGKELLSVSSRAFYDLMDFANECIKNNYIAIVDSITHPWRSLCEDYLDAKRSRVKGAGGNPETARLSLKDWGPLKDMWNKFSEKFVYSPCHFCIVGREGDVWETVEDDEGKEEMKKTGVKMKTESEFGYEPSLLVQMRLQNNNHIAFVPKDRFDVLTGKFSENNPDISFFKPHIDMLNLGGKHTEKSDGKKVFNAGSGPNYETIKAQRAAVLENIKDDILLVYPGQTAAEKKAKVEALRSAFGTSAWTELEEDNKKHPIEALKAGREKLATILKGASNVTNA